jgi:hypothetical protein
MSLKSEAIHTEVVGLVGHYCPLCVASMRSYLIAEHSIVPMCREDLDQILHNGDMGRITKMLEAKEIAK